MDNLRFDAKNITSWQNFTGYSIQFFLVNYYYIVPLTLNSQRAPPQPFDLLLLTHHKSFFLQYVIDVLAYFFGFCVRLISEERTTVDV